LIKRVAFISLVAAFLICGVWGYLYLQQLKKPTVKTLDMLSDSCTALIEIKNPREFIQQLTQGNLIWEEALHIPQVKNLQTYFLFFDSLLITNQATHYIGEESLYLAFYSSKGETQMVFAFNLPDVTYREGVITFARDKLHAIPDPVHADVYRCELKSKTSSFHFFMSIRNGIILASGEAELIRTPGPNPSRKALSANHLFMEAHNASSNDKGISVFCHFPSFYKNTWSYIFQYADPSFASDTLEQWIYSDLEAEPSLLKAEGFLHPGSSSLTASLLKQETLDLQDLYMHVPYHVNWLEAAAIHDYPAFVKDNYVHKENDRKNEMRQYSDSLLSDADSEISSFIGDYIAFFETGKDTLCPYGIIQVKDKDKTNTFLRQVTDSSHMQSDSTIIYTISNSMLFKRISAGFFDKPFRYASVINEGLLFSNSVKAISAYKQFITDRSNFSYKERSMHFLRENFTSEANYLFYAEVSQTKAKLRSFLSERLALQIDEAPGLYEKFDILALTFQKLKSKLFFQARAGFNPQYKLYPNTLWETMVDTNLRALPALVTNHVTNENELVCQDAGNNLYLVSSTGKILWKKNIQEEIMGNISQIDFFGNGKLQFLFATENNIHLMDRNGNYVKDFPVRIKAGAAGGISLFDYDKNKNYRLWIPLRNNTVVCLTSSCKLVDGFNPIPVKYKPGAAIRQLIVQQKDYFILTDTVGNVYVTNRKGEQRFAMRNRVPVDSPIYFDVGKDPSKTYICFIDIKAKKLCKLSLSDKLAEILLPSEKDIQSYFFDSLSHTSPIVVLSGKNSLEQFDFFGRKLKEITLETYIKPGSSVLKINDRVTYIGLGVSSDALILTDTEKEESKESELKLNALPGVYRLIKGQPDYLIGYWENKIFCVQQ
jgi:hypothetical protein